MWLAYVCALLRWYDASYIYGKILLIDKVFIDDVQENPVQNCLQNGDHFVEGLMCSSMDGI